MMQKMADLAEALPDEGPAAGGKGRGRQPKEVPLRQRLVESWEGKVCCRPPPVHCCNTNLSSAPSTLHLSLIPSPPYPPSPSPFPSPPPRPPCLSLSLSPPLPLFLSSSPSPLPSPLPPTRFLYYCLRCFDLPWRSPADILRTAGDDDGRFKLTGGGRRLQRRDARGGRRGRQRHQRPAADGCVEEEGRAGKGGCRMNRVPWLPALTTRLRPLSSLQTSSPRTSASRWPPPSLQSIRRPVGRRPPPSEPKGSAEVNSKAPAAAGGGGGGGGAAASKARKAAAPKPRAVRKAGKAAAEAPSKAKAVVWAEEEGPAETEEAKEEHGGQQREAPASEDPSRPPQEGLKHNQPGGRASALVAEPRDRRPSPGLDPIGSGYRRPGRAVRGRLEAEVAVAGGERAAPQGARGEREGARRGALRAQGDGASAAGGARGAQEPPGGQDPPPPPPSLRIYLPPVIT